MPLGTLRYLYQGSEDIDADVAYYRDAVGAELVWDFARFETRVAALRVGNGPLILLAHHRPAPSCLLVYEVEDLESAVAALRERGCEPDGEAFGIPNGPCYRFTDPSGNIFAIFKDENPGKMEAAYADPETEYAVREED